MRNTNASSPRRLTERAQIRMESSLTLLTKRPCTNHRLTHAISRVYHWPTGATKYGMTLNQKKGVEMTLRTAGAVVAIAAAVVPMAWAPAAVPASGDSPGRLVLLQKERPLDEVLD